MSRKTMKLTSLVLMAGLLVGLAWMGPAAGADRHEITGKYVPGEVIVKFKPGVTRERSKGVLSEDDLSVKRENKPLGFKVVKLPGGKTVAETVDELNADPAVEYAEPNYIDEIDWTPDDPLYSSNQWHMKDYASGGIDAQAAWDIERGDSSVIIAVVDTGVAYENYGTYTQAPDLAGTTFVSPYDAVDLDGHPNDTVGHGTHVTGTIAQTTNNALGTAGVAHGCSIMPVRTLGTGGGYHEQMADGFAWATDHGAKIINYSASGSDSATKRDACQYAYEHGVTICASYGNEGLQDPIYCYPAAYDEFVVCVGATTRTRSLASYSNYGTHADVVAPGGDTSVVEADGVWQQTYATYQDPSSGFSYQGWNGTSMAAPHVSATAGLFISHTGVSAPDSVRQRLQSTARDLGGAGWDQYFGYGLIDALAVVDNPVPNITSLAPDRATEGGAGLTMTVHGTGFLYGESVVRWNSTNLDTAYVSGTRLDAQVTAAQLETTGPATITVLNPAPGGGTSNSATFTVEARGPVLEDISPKALEAGGPGFDLTVNGTNFIQQSMVRWNGEYRDTTFISSAQLRAKILPQDIDEPGNCEVRVHNPDAEGGVLSGAKTFSVVPGPQTWYLPEGTTAWGFETYISIINPNAAGVHAAITYNTEAGPVDAPTVYLAPQSRATVYPRESVGASDFSTEVTCAEQKQIAVDRTMIWTGSGASAAESHSSIGITSPATTWYLPEGSSAWGFECWLLIQNPELTDATCQVTYMLDGAAPVTVNKQVPANSRRTFNVADDIGTADASIKVTSNTPVIPERAMYKNARREGHDSIGTAAPAARYYLAEGTTAWGFTTYVLIQNPNGVPIDVNVTYMTPAGPKPHPPFTMAASSRRTIKVNDVLPDTDFSTVVQGSSPIIAERAMYWDSPAGEACHDSIGMSAPHRTFLLPDGQVAANVETWTLVQNPNHFPVEVQITYLPEDGSAGGNVVEILEADSRRSFNMADAGVQGRAGINVHSPNGDIMVERAMYFNGRTGGSDTIGGLFD